jgi:hypothetical protein
LPGYDQSWWQLFRFADPAINPRLIAEGVLPWWSDPQLKISFCRPLSALTHELDYALWPHSQAAMHAHSLFYLAVLLVAVFALYRELFDSRVAVCLALSLYGFDNTRILPIAWLANRNTLIACALSTFALTLQLRRGASKRDRWLSALLFGAGLAAGEGAIAIVGYLIASAFFLDHAPPRERALKLAPHALVAIVYLGIARAFGYGVAYSGAYLDPLTDFAHYARAFPGRAVALIGAEEGAAGAELWSAYDLMLPGLSIVVAIYIAVVTALLARALWPLVRSSARARFFLVGALLALPPSAASSPHGRTLSWVSIGVMGLFAEFLLAHDRGRTYQRVIAASLVIVHMILSPLTIPGGIRAVAGVEEHWERAARAIARFRRPEQDTVIYLNPPQDPLVVFTTALEAERTEKVVRQRWLYSGFSPLRVTRNDARTLEVEVAAGFVREETERLFRGDAHRFSVGQRVDLPGLHVEILALTRDARPERVRFQFDRSLDDPRYLWLEWRDDDFVPYQPPAVGAGQSLAANDFASTMFGPEHPLTRILAHRHAHANDGSAQNP